MDKFLIQIRKGKQYKCSFTYTGVGDDEGCFFQYHIVVKEKIEIQDSWAPANGFVFPAAACVVFEFLQGGEEGEGGELGFEKADGVVEVVLIGRASDWAGFVDWCVLDKNGFRQKGQAFLGLGDIFEAVADISA